jgi:hypothetical protein
MGANDAHEKKIKKASWNRGKQTKFKPNKRKARIKMTYWWPSWDESVMGKYFKAKRKRDPEAVAKAKARLEEMLKRWKERFNVYKSKKTQSKNESPKKTD